MYKSNRGTGVTTLLAILLTSGAVILEFMFRFCSETFFDPIPTPLHLVLTGAVPVSLLISLRLLNSPYSRAGDRIALVCIGIAFSVSAVYSVLFITAAPWCIIGILFLGIGLLGLSPYFALIASFLLLRQWQTYRLMFAEGEDEILEVEQHLEKRRKTGRFVWIGVLPAAVALWWCQIIAGSAAQMLAADSPSMKYTGLSLLRHGMSEQSVHDICNNKKKMNDRLWWDRMQVGERKELREACRYLYGQSEGNGTRRQWFSGDRNRGGDRVGDVIPGLELAWSALDITVDEESGISCTDWTLTFYNDNPAQAEARAFIHLPPCGAVTQATLWIDGRECPAAFGTTGQVKRAYRKVVTARRDPLLVTYVAPEVVRVQCFPVPPKGAMKVRIGITAPLVHGGYTRLPSFQSHNFDIPGKMQHAVTIQGDRAVTLQSGESIPVQPQVPVYLEDTALRMPSQVITCTTGKTVVRSSENSTGEKPILIVDGVKDAAGLFSDAEKIRSMFSKVYCARPFDCVEWDGREQFGKFLRAAGRYRMVNATYALDAAVKEAHEKNVPVVWVYSELPGEKSDEFMNVLRQYTHNRVIAYAVNTRSGSFPYAPEICRFVIDCPATGNFERDIKAVLHRGTMRTNGSIGDETQFPAGGRYEHGLLLPVGKAKPGTGMYALRIHSQVMEKWYKGRGVSGELKQQAIAARVVTPVTGAVVLENSAQYKENGLDPDAGEKSPVSVAEPGLLFMIMLGLGALMVRRIRRRNFQGRHMVSVL